MEGSIILINDDHELLIKKVHDNCSCIAPVDQGCSCGFLVEINMRHNTNNKTVPFRSNGVSRGRTDLPRSLGMIWLFLYVYSFSVLTY
jgi:hypothetical protein